MKKFKNYYLNKLYKETNQAKLNFAFNITINLMRALYIICENEIKTNKIKNFYKNLIKIKYKIRYKSF